MKTILLPTDFKKHSEKALDFSIEIAKLTGAKIITTNSYLLPAIDILAPIGLAQEIYDDERESSASILKNYCERIGKTKLKNGNNLRAEYISTANLLLSGIQEIVQQKNIDMIIMGTEDKEHRYQFWSSTTMDVLKTTNVPTLIIHEDSDWKPFNKILFALDNVKEGLLKIKSLIPIAQLFNAEISVVHITKFPEDIHDLEEANQNKAEYENLISEIKQTYHYPKINLSYYFSDNTFTKTDNLLQSRSPDLIAITKSTKTWLDTLFQESFTEHLIRKVNKPLIVL